MLPDPAAGMAGGLFLCRGGEGFGAIAVAGEADAEIGILRHIERIPCPHLLQHGAAQEQRGAAQRDRQAEAFEPGQDQAEPAAIFQREAAGDPALAGGVEIEPALNAAEAGIARVEAGDDLPDLIRGRRVFGVIDADDAAPATGQGEAERARFGLGAARGDEHRG